MMMTPHCPRRVRASAEPRSLARASAPRGELHAGIGARAAAAISPRLTLLREDDRRTDALDRSWPLTGERVLTVESGATTGYCRATRAATSGVETRSAATPKTMADAIWRPARERLIPIIV